MKYIIKTTWRAIRTFFGRYMALLLIVATSVGFFSGLKITQAAMLDTADKFYDTQCFYDYRLLSTLGFTAEDVDALAAMEGVEAAEGSITLDAMMVFEGKTQPLKLLALPQHVNLPSVCAGRMPRTDEECLADDERFTEADIGKTVTLSEENPAHVSDQLVGKEYTIVGLVDSPLYMGLDRGTTDIGTGALYSFLYLPEANFQSDVYTEVNLWFGKMAKSYSDTYDEAVEERKAQVVARCQELADARYEELLSQVVVPPALASMGVSATQVAEEAGLLPPVTYVLTRNENAGYLSFENDTSIVSGIANIFPIFFILIAILVCMTTMTRMVDEERTQIGTLKAMGMGNGRIMAKYVLYAGSATCIGWAVGFLLCTWGLPKIFWFAYGALYNFAPLTYLFSPSLAGGTLLISLVGILGAALISCRKELGEVPARLIRPRASKNGKRILLERFTPLWSRLPFLQKIILRNMFRYKGRLAMMLVGIGCCAGLVVTAFGVKDSMTCIGTLQYDTIQTYDIQVTYEEGNQESVEAMFTEAAYVQAYQSAAVHRVDVLADTALNSVTMMSFADTERLTEFWHFYNGKSDIALPAKGEAIINTKIAEKLNLHAGDTFRIRDKDMQDVSVKVSGIFENYVNNILVISADTYQEAFGTWNANTGMLRIQGDPDEAAQALMDLPEVTGVSLLSTTRENIQEALQCLHYIIWLVVGFSGALAFIVIFNLTNIHIAERSREIATVEVLGFSPKETNSYVLRENLILSVIASLIGLPLGKLFHALVMYMIQIDSMTFARIIAPTSYVLSVMCTLLFAVIVNLVMRRQISKIKMAESLKAVE